MSYIGSSVVRTRVEVTPEPSRTTGWAAATSTARSTVSTAGAAGGGAGRGAASVTSPSTLNRVVTDGSTLPLSICEIRLPVTPI